MMQLSDMLKIKKGITSFIGGGGKTTLIHTLAESLGGRVILCATTHMYPSERFPTILSLSDQEIADGLKRSRVICVGVPCKDGKITIPAAHIGRIANQADFILVEADGSRQRPMKAHSACEPVIPDNSTQTILVAGASAFGQPISECVHRPKLYAELADVPMGAEVTPLIAAKVIKKEGLADRLFVNQIETRKTEALAREFALLVGLPAAGGSLRQKEYMPLSG